VRTGRKKLVVACTTVAVTTVGALSLGEFVVRIVKPQITMFPRREFSAEYGFLNFEDTRITHSRGSEWSFTYTTNHLGNRGEVVPVSNAYDVPNLLVLGDSYSFGIGVDDGEEYPSVLAERLRGRYRVTNLSVGGWGLAQQIRRYYEFGQVYLPDTVLLQFCRNDPGDNLNNRVTLIEDGRFSFVDSGSKLNWIKRYLSHSLIQRSHLYNLFRDSVYRYFASRHVKKVSESLRKGGGGEATAIPPEEQFHCELLELFARDLRLRGVRLLMIAVNGELGDFPFLEQKVLELDSDGLLDYVEVAEFFQGVTDYDSPEGHKWGKKAHGILGERLSDLITRLDLDRG